MGHVVSTKPMSEVDIERLEQEVAGASFDSQSEYRSKKNKDKHSNGQLRNQSIDESTGEECPICTEDILLRDLAKLDPCNHEFHQECINQWLEDHSTCPNCRADVSQVVFNYKRCAIKKFSSEEFYEEEVEDEDEDDDDDDDDDDEEDEEEEDEEEEDHGENDPNSIDSQSDFNNLLPNLDSLQSVSVERNIVLGDHENMSGPEWDDLQDLSDPENNSSNHQIEIEITDEESICITFCFKYPEAIIQPTDMTCPWQLFHSDQLIADVPPAGQVTLRGSYFLNLLHFSIQLDGQTLHLKEDASLNEFLNPSEEAISQMSVLQLHRTERIRLFMDFLRTRYLEG